MNKRLYLIILFFAITLTSVAQTEDERYRAIYDQAEQDYNIGRIDEARQALTANMSNFPITLQLSAYRLLSLCELTLDNTDAAERCVQLMLDINPYYSTTLSDPQRFIDMVESLKAGRTATITTASSQAESLNEVPVPTTLITREMIQDCGARNLQEVLVTYVPGMNIVDGNDDINIAMRGIYSNGQEKILIMLNGHRLNSFATNIAAPDFSMSLDKVRQIEVLRGPASSLYGGVSLTAVVNVITLPGAEVDGVEARVGAGNYGQIMGNMLFGKRYFDLQWRKRLYPTGRHRYADDGRRRHHRRHRSQAQLRRRHTDEVQEPAVLLQLGFLAGHLPLHHELHLLAVHFRQISYF